MPLAILINPDDPLFNFEHMMQHRETFAAMSPLSGFSALPYLLDPGIDQHIPANNWNNNHQQAHDDFNKTLPSNYENGYTLTHTVPPAATGTANSTGTTSVAISGVTNKILIGSTMTPPGVHIIDQQSGPPGGDGTYTTDQATTLSNVPVTITHIPYEQANPLTGGTFGIPQSQILVEGTGQSPENRSWWTFANHQEHFNANSAILPLPTTAPTTAGTPPGVKTVSSPWWWTHVAPVIFPYW